MALSQSVWSPIRRNFEINSCQVCRACRAIFICRQQAVQGMFLVPSTKKVLWNWNLIQAECSRPKKKLKLSQIHLTKWQMNSQSLFMVLTCSSHANHSKCLCNLHHCAHIRFAFQASYMSCGKLQLWKWKPWWWAGSRPTCSVAVLVEWAGMQMRVILDRESSFSNSALVSDANFNFNAENFVGVQNSSACAYVLHTFHRLTGHCRRLKPNSSFSLVECSSITELFGIRSRCESRSKSRFKSKRRDE